MQHCPATAAQAEDVYHQHTAAPQQPLGNRLSPTETVPAQRTRMGAAIERIARGRRP